MLEERIERLIDVGALEWIYYLKLKNEPNDYIPWKDPDDTPFI